MKKKTRLLLGALIVVLAVGAWLLIQSGVWQLNHPNLPVKGVDVSHYQGQIDWPTLADQDLRFAFVKATEGSASRDETFEANWSGARAAGLRVGAYHFFSYDSPGADQAANYMAAVPAEPDALPPVIDVEFYGTYDHVPAAPEAVVPELMAMIDALRARYGVSPILYVTSKSWSLYVRDRIEGCDLWFRNVFARPVLPKGQSWTFWQYADRGRLDGYSGAERFIDLDVFYGSEAEFAAYPNP